MIAIYVMYEGYTVFVPEEFIKDYNLKIGQNITKAQFSDLAKYQIIQCKNKILEDMDGHQS